MKILQKIFMFFAQLFSSDPAPADPLGAVLPEDKTKPGFTPKVPGKEVDIAGRTLVIAPLNAASVKQYRDQIKQVHVGGLPDIELVAKLAHASLRRNYPSITLEDVEDMIDYGNFFDVWENLLNVTGLVAQAGNMVRRVQEQMTTAGLTG